MMTDDDRLLAELRTLWSATDPPPADLAEAMLAAVAAADLDDDLELLVLVRDSADEPAAQVRGPGTARVLYFRAVQGWTLDAEIDADQVRGQLLDFTGDLGQVEIALETREGERWSTGLDDYGFFTIPATLSGSIRFTVADGGTDSSSRWVEL